MTRRSTKDSSNDEAAAAKEDEISIAPSVDSSEVFLSPNECLRGLTNVDLMNIAENGDVFQQFVRSMSGDQTSPSPTSRHGASTGAVPKKEWHSPHTPRVPIPVRRNSSSLLRVLSHDGDGERNLRLYLQDSGRAGQDGRCLFRRRLMKEEDDRRREADLQRRQAETVLSEEKKAGSVFCPSYPNDCPNGKRCHNRLRFDSVDSGQTTFPSDSPKMTFQNEASADGNTTTPSAMSRFFRRISRKAFSRRHRNCCPFFCGNGEEETSEEFLTRMDRFAEATALRSNSRWRRCRNRLRGFFKYTKNSLVRLARFIFSCCCCCRQQ